jgi:superfamily II DNA or RNA helicase
MTESEMIIPRCVGIAEYPSFVDQTSEGSLLEYNFTGVLKSHQEAPANAALASLNTRPHCTILVLPCGFGKTFVSLYVASQLRRKTIIIVHKEFLLDQWRERIAEFMPGTKVGIIQGDKFETDNDVVIAMIQSLAVRSYNSDELAKFGTCICDEGHHMAARMFSEVFFRVPAKYILGLTATPTRKDGMTNVLHMFMGPFCFKQDQHVEDQNVMIKRVEYKSGRVFTCDLSNGAVQKLKSRLAKDTRRNQLLLHLCVLSTQAGRKVILLGDRVEHLKDLHTAFQRICSNISSALYIGGMKATSRADAEKCSMIFGTYNMASEGLDVPALDTLILASPTSDCVQSTGRILRPCETKMNPFVWDIVDDTCRQFTRYAECRLNYFERQGFTIETINHDAAVTF